MMHLNPLVLVGAVIGVITALLVAAYAAVKDKKTATVSYTHLTLPTNSRV